MSRKETYSRQELAVKLTCLCEDLDDLYNVNREGCCFLTYCIARELEKRNISFALVLFDDDYLPSNSCIYNNIKKHNKYGIPLGEYTSNHYTLKIDNVVINPFIRDNNRVIYNITSKDIKYIYYHGRWNSRYNRKYNRAISRLINKFFKDYDKEEC